MASPLPGDRGRLREAFALSQRYQQKEAQSLRGVAVGIRTLGLGQVLLMLERSDDANILGSLLAAVKRFVPGVHSDQLLDVVAAWVDIRNQQTIADVEEYLTAWVVDINLLANLTTTLQERFQPQALSDRAETAALAALEIDASERPRAKALPWEIQQHSLVRAIAVLARERTAKGEEMASGLATAILHRVARFVPSTPKPPTLQQILEAVLSDEAGPALEAEALLFSVELKKWLTALDNADKLAPPGPSEAVTDVARSEVPS